MLGKAEGSVDSLPNPQSCMPHHIDGMAGEQQTKKQKAPTTQCSGGNSHSVHTWLQANDHHWVEHMPATGKLQGVAGVQTPMVEPPGVNMASSRAHLKVETRQQNIHQTYNIQNSGRLNSGKRNLPVENPRHNWHRPEEALKMEVAAVAWRQGQEHLQSISVSGVAAEPHHADPTL